MTVPETYPVDMLVPVPNIGDAELSAIQSCYWLLTSGMHYQLTESEGKPGA